MRWLALTLALLIARPAYAEEWTHRLSLSGSITFGVSYAFVFGLERPDHEQEMHAAVVLAGGTGVEDVLAFCRAQALQPYEVPHRVHALDRLPRTGMGKVDRHRIERQVREVAGR